MNLSEFQNLMDKEIREQFPYERYKNMISGNEVIITFMAENVVYVKYIKGGIRTGYSIEYFDNTFNPITDDKYDR